MKKSVSLALCVICVCMFSAYDWGKKPKAQTETVTNAGTSWQTSSANAKEIKTNASAAWNGSFAAKAVPNAAVAMDKTGMPSQASNAANDKAAAISTLAKIVGSGTPAERAARIESFKRVSQALAQSQAQGQAQNQTKKSR